MVFIIIKKNVYIVNDLRAQKIKHCVIFNIYEQIIRYHFIFRLICQLGKYSLTYSRFFNISYKQSVDVRNIIFAFILLIKKS